MCVCRHWLLPNSIDHCWSGAGRCQLDRMVKSVKALAGFSVKAVVGSNLDRVKRMILVVIYFGTYIYRGTAGTGFCNFSDTGYRIEDHDARIL